MKRKIIVVFLLMTFLISSVFAGATNVVNDNGMAPLSNEEETYYIYGRNAHSISGGGSGSWQYWGEHGLRLSQGSLPIDYCTAKYYIYIDCSNKGLINDKFTLGVYFKDNGVLGDGPEMILQNPSTGEWDLKWDTIGQPSSLTWKYFEIDANYIDSSDKKVHVKFHAGYLDDTVIDMLSATYEDVEETDQNLIDYDTSSETGYYAQSFKPTFKKLTRVKFLLDNDQILNVGNFYFCICKSIQPWKPITVPYTSYSARFDTQTVPGPKRWAVADLPDVELVPNEIYYLCMDLRNSNGISWQYDTGSTYADGSYYLDGNDVYSDWKKSPGKTYCIKTYGTSSSDFDAELTTDPADGGLLNFNTVHNGGSSTKSIRIKNTGDKGSALQWEIKDEPSWLDFSKDEDILYNNYCNVNSESIDVTVDTSSLEGSRDGVEHTGSFKVYNKETGGYSKINVKVIVIKTRSVEYPSSVNLFRSMISQHPLLLKLFQLSSSFIFP